MSYSRPIVISIAGFDPSGGAGVLADAKTIENLGGLAFGVITAQTVQTEDQFISVNWNSEAFIFEQLRPLLANYTISAVKIGLIEDLDTLGRILAEIKAYSAEIPIVWDPVLSASAGKIFHSDLNGEQLKNILSQVSVITPNVLEVRRLVGDEDEFKSATILAQFTNVLLKGGHSLDKLGTDFLITENEVVEIPIQLQDKNCFPKHGSGCILSSALAVNLALGKSMSEACTLAKKYTEERLASNEHLLAYHVG